MAFGGDSLRQVPAKGSPFWTRTAQEATLPVRNLATSSSENPDLTKLPMVVNFLARLRGGGADHAEWTALNRKFAEPLAATAFALFALAIGLYSFRRNFGLGIVSVLFLTFIYYAVWSVSNLLGRTGNHPRVRGRLVARSALRGGGQRSFSTQLEALVRLDSLLSLLSLLSLHCPL